MHKLAAFAAVGPDALSAPLLPALVRKFRDRVDAEMPGLYTWLADSSLHITLRSLLRAQTWSAPEATDTT